MAALCLGWQVQAAEPTSEHRTGPTVLSLEELDRVTAGSVFAQIDLSATATGANAFTLVSAGLQTLRGNALILNLRPGPSGTALPSFLGSRDIDITTGSGTAYAAGDKSASCSASATLQASNALFSQVSSSAASTGTVALCLCSLFAVSFAH